jgi:rod shape-determining protein MreD
MIRRYEIPKWIAYSLAIFILAVIQMTPHFLPRFFGVSPLYLIPAVIAVAMVEGEMPGAVFGAFAGLIWDASVGGIFGFNAFLLMLVGLIAGFLVQYLFRNNVGSALIFTFGVTFVYELISWFCFYYLGGKMFFVFSIVEVILPTAVYTLVFGAPLYYGAALIKKKLTPAIE